MTAVPTRRIAFEFDARRLPRHYSDNDVLSSHAMTLASATFPEGEEFFVRSVRKVRGRIRDPELRERVNGFIGQEVMHGRAHVSFNQALGRLGYPTAFINRFVAIYLRLLERILPKSVQLAMDPSAWRLSKLRQSWRNLRDLPIASDDFLALLRDYNRLDFHPDDHDTTELVAEWRARLFEGDGYLVGRSKGVA